MSLLVGSVSEFFKNGFIRTFDQWLLIEAIKPIQTSYGSNPPNFDNKQIVSSTQSIGTFFIYSNNMYMVQIHENGEIAFGGNKRIPNSLEELIDMQITDDRLLSISGTAVFGRVFYVLLEVLKHSNNVNLYFRTTNDNLTKLYNTLTKNKNFLNELSKVGYSMSKIDNQYVLTKL